MAGKVRKCIYLASVVVVPVSQCNEGPIGWLTVVSITGGRWLSLNL